jgi:hypothetical protein
VRDLGSIQGTYLNGQRISAEQPLNDGDLLRLGASGPEVQFLLSDRAQVAEPSREPSRAQPGKPALSHEELAQILEDEQAGQLARDAATAARKRRLIRILASSVTAVIVVAGALYVWRLQAAKRAEEDARLLLLARADSLMASVAELSVTTPAMRTSLDSSRQAATRLRAALEEAGPGSPDSPGIMARLDSAISRERDIARAAAFDHAMVAGPNLAAVGFVIARYADGRTALASGFGVRRDGTGGVLLTTRQVLVDPQGNTPVEVLVRMPGEPQPIVAEIITTHTTEDVALLRVPVRGGIPVVQGLAWQEPPVAAGTPLAIVGYAPPFTPPADGDWRKAAVSLTTATGTAARVASEFVTVDGWGSSVGAGSPVLDAQGLVAGMIATAAPSAGGRLYDAVPMKFALELLDQLQ